MINLKNFKNVSGHFQLGDLTTESFNSKTTNLSKLASNDLNQALKLFKEVDQIAFECIQKKYKEIEQLKSDIEKVLSSGGSIILVGCGATGRLCLSLEKDYKSFFGEKLISLMAGGDSALVRSIESFEDSEEYCFTHLDEISLNDQDLVIAITEGGETPFVLAAVDCALVKTKVRPWLLFCNPEKELYEVERSHKHLTNDKVRKLALLCGAQAISGSTRLQASSVQLLSMTLAFESLLTSKSVKTLFEEFLMVHNEVHYEKLSEFIYWEECIYKNNKRVLYRVSEDLSLVVFTDITERAPTFSLTPFKNHLKEEKSSPVGFELFNQGDFWKQVLGRRVRIIDFPGVVETSFSYMQNFEFKRLKSHYEGVEICSVGGNLSFKFDSKEISYNLNNSWHSRFILKLLLNAHSSVLMCRLGRVDGNMMVWVKPSNYKLIDRTIRYTKELLKRDGYHVNYEDCMKFCLKEIDNIESEKSFVLNLAEKIKKAI